MKKIKPRQPVCPSCSVEGAEFIVSCDSCEQSGSKEPKFQIVYCSQCGYVYGVLNKSIDATIVGNIL